MSAGILERGIREVIGGELDRLGVLHRMFVRVKAPDSIAAKLGKKSYSADGKRMQDLCGIRVVLYFQDDVALCAEIAKSRFSCVDVVVDDPGNATFGPTRFNMVFKLPQELVSVARAICSDERVDNTFELQLRTILSEGWHEVEHDLRYKRPSDWDGHPDLYRAYNGIVATLETCDWTALQVFDELTLRHYRQRNWDALMRAKYRLRFGSAPLYQPLSDLLSSSDLGKRLFRHDRVALLRAMMLSGLRLPITVDNVVYVANRLAVSSAEIRQLEPAAVTEAFERWPLTPAGAVQGGSVPPS